MNETAASAYAGSAETRYTVSVAATLAGMHAQTLRQYDRLGLVSPGRTKGRGRRYSTDDIERLRHIQDLTRIGINLAGVRQILSLEEQIHLLQGEIADLRRAVEKGRSPTRGVFTADSHGRVHLRPHRVYRGRTYAPKRRGEIAAEENEVSSHRALATAFNSASAEENSHSPRGGRGAFARDNEADYAQRLTEDMRAALVKDSGESGEDGRLDAPSHVSLQGESPSGRVPRRESRGTAEVETEEIREGFRHTHGTVVEWAHRHRALVPDEGVSGWQLLASLRLRQIVEQRREPQRTP